MFSFKDMINELVFQTEEKLLYSYDTSLDSSTCSEDQSMY